MVKRFADSSRPFYTPGYRDSLENWSREARIHRGLEVELILSATFKSRAFRRAYTREYAAAYKLDAAEKERFMEAQMRAADLDCEFLVAAFFPQEDWDDFDDGQSMWRIRLINDAGERIRPSEIRRIKEKGALMTHFFPYITPWKSVYVVRFPPMSPEKNGQQGADKITLEVASVLGSTQLEWPMADSDETQDSM
jgi:hypothetical protein